MRYIKAFLQFCCKFRFSRVHLVGCDFGGWLCAQIASYDKLCVEIGSVTIINSYTDNSLFRSLGLPIKVLGSLAAKKTLINELSIKPSFIMKELDHIDASALCSRILLRSFDGITKTLPPQFTLVVEALDSHHPHTPPENPTKEALMRSGGDWPHIYAPDDLYPLMISQLMKTHQTLKSDLTDDNPGDPRDSSH